MAGLLKSKIPISASANEKWEYYFTQRAAYHFREHLPEFWFQWPDIVYPFQANWSSGSCQWTHSTVFWWDSVEYEAIFRLESLPWWLLSENEGREIGSTYLHKYSHCQHSQCTASLLSTDDLPLTAGYKAKKVIQFPRYDSLKFPEDICPFWNCWFEFQP